MGAIVSLGLYVDSPESWVETSLDPRPGMLGLVLNPPGVDAMYQVVKLDATADAAAVAKDVVYWRTPALYTITTTIGESESTKGNSTAGAVTVAVPISSYCMLKVKGAQSTKANTGTAGTMSTFHTSANQVTDNLETLFQKLLGVCTVAESGGFATIRWDVEPV